MSIEIVFKVRPGDYQQDDFIKENIRRAIDDGDIVIHESEDEFLFMDDENGENDGSVERDRRCIELQVEALTPTGEEILYSEMLKIDDEMHCPGCQLYRSPTDRGRSIKESVIEMFYRRTQDDDMFSHWDGSWDGNMVTFDCYTMPEVTFMFYGPDCDKLSEELEAYR